MVGRALRSGWLRLADDFYDDPRLLDVSSDAEHLFVRGLAYSKRHALDGLVPLAALPRLDAKFAGPVEAACAELISAHLWVKRDGAVGVPADKWITWQETREQEATSRAKAAERQRRYAERRAKATEANGTEATGDAANEST